MSLGLNKTKRRIASIKGTEKTTKAMEMIATVKLKRFRDAFDRESVYSKEFEVLMSKLFSFDKEIISHYGRTNEGDLPTLYIVISSNLGLCGSYNSALFKYVERQMKENDVIAPIGNKAMHHFSSLGCKISDELSSLTLSDDIGELHEACLELKNSFNEKKYKNIVIVYTRYVNSLNFVPSSFQLLPIQLNYSKTKNDESNPPDFDESPRSMIHRLMPYYLTSMFYDRMIESQLSEQASRRNAMQNANDNADELLEKLTIEYNKARQNAITQEITEVVGGANAT
ncbi:MAG: ATP synthase F1 subunit gamma [Bacilli bacterium]|nr:ATP synthase F1 subunit gamma [Bacilli bacterium]